MADNENKVIQAHCDEEAAEALMGNQKFHGMERKRAATDDMDGDKHAAKKTSHALMSSERFVRHQLTRISLARAEAAVEYGPMARERSVFDDNPCPLLNVDITSADGKSGAQKEMLQALSKGSRSTCTTETIVDAPCTSEQVIEEVKSLADEPGGMDALAFALDAKALIGKPQEAIIEAMWNYLFDAGVQAQACEALKKLARNNEDKLAIGQDGGIDLIVAAMRNHPSSTKIQEEGSAALMALVDLQMMDLALLDESQLRFFASGAICVVVAAMLNHPSSAKVQEHGCGVLWMLAFKVSDKVAIVLARVLHAIVTAMRNHPHIAILQGWGGRALISVIAAPPLAARNTVPQAQHASVTSPQKAPVTPFPELSPPAAPALSLLMDPVLETLHEPTRNVKEAVFKVIMTENFNSDGKLLEARFEVHEFENLESPDDGDCLITTQEL